MERASVEQGLETQIFCKLNHALPFEGTATVQILGLPAMATTTDMEFNKDTKELVFNIKTDKTSPAGKHTNVFAQITITKDGEPMISRAATTQLQIDKPLPPPKNAPPKPKPKPMPVAVAATAPKPAPKPMAKPLTRLEKLRLAAQQRVNPEVGGGEE
jgi:outer membrane biosynthesis protein TonB